MFRRVADFLSYTSIFLSFSIACLVWETQLLLGESISNSAFAVFVFFVTLTYYNIHRYFRLKYMPAAEKHAKRMQWTFQYKRWWYLTGGIGILGTVISSIFCLTLPLISWLLPVIIVTLLYSIPLLPGKQRLRDLPYLKLIVVSLVITWITVYLPFLYYQESSPVIFFLFISRLLLVIAVTIPFDVRDMQYDAAQQVKTFPLLLGVDRVKRVGISLLILFALLTLIYSVNTIPMLLTAGVAIIMLLNVNSQRSDYFYTFGLEGIFVMNLVFTMLFH